MFGKDVDGATFKDVPFVPCSRPLFRAITSSHACLRRFGAIGLSRVPWGIAPPLNNLVRDLLTSVSAPAMPHAADQSRMVCSDNAINSAWPALGTRPRDFARSGSGRSRDSRRRTRREPAIRAIAASHGSRGAASPRAGDAIVCRARAGASHSISACVSKPTLAFRGSRPLGRGHALSRCRTQPPALASPAAAVSESDHSWPLRYDSTGGRQESSKSCPRPPEPLTSATPPRCSCVQPRMVAAISRISSLLQAPILQRAGSGSRFRGNLDSGSDLDARRRSKKWRIAGDSAKRYCHWSGCGLGTLLCTSFSFSSLHTFPVTRANM